MKPFARLLVFLFGALLAGLTFAQSYPARPVKFVVPWPPGGGADFVARAFGAELSRIWGQPVVVENVSGAGSIVGAERAANAAPDGYTLMLTINGTVVGNRFLYKKLPYDPERSFVPVTLLVQSGQLILANASLGANNLRELVELAKRQPGKIAYASYGMGTQPHLLFETLNKREGVDLLHVPYRGLAPALTAVMSGEVQLTVVSPSSATAALKSGMVKPLAIGSEQRAGVMREVPTVAESGYSYLAAIIWFGLFAPAGTPSALVERIQRDAAATTRKNEFTEGMTTRGFDVVASTPEQFASAIHEEVARTAEMVRAAGVQPE